MNSSYKFYEIKYNNTKPIRGRSTDVRPIGERRRDWETITSKDVDGGKSYTANLYNTECVEYLPNNDIIIRCGSWATPTTAEFIHEHSPFTCFKRYNKLWIQNHEELLPINGELRMKYFGDNDWWKPAEEIVIKQQVVDKQLAKTAREPLMPFLRFGEAFFKMSDGWLMHETRMQVGIGITPWGRYQFDKIEGINGIGSGYEKMYDYIATCDESEYLYILCYLLQNHEYQEQRLAEVQTIKMNEGTESEWERRCEFKDYKYSNTLLRGRVFNIAKQARNIYKVIDVKPSGKAVTNTL